MTDQLSPDFYNALLTPTESLEVEFKRSLPLKENAGKAKLAKEICALANHGGGWIVFGREDDGSFSDATEIAKMADIDQDLVNQVAATYLQPSPHCSVQKLQPDGVDFELPVIWVPACGTVPVCAKKNGPTSDKGNSTVGVIKGTHYIRKAGPVSAAIESPNEWQDVLRRCVLSDKAALLGALSTMIEKPRSVEKAEKQSVFEIDFEQIVTIWKEEAQKHPYEIDLNNCFVAYGFDLLNAEPETTEQIKDCLQKRPLNSSGYKFFDFGHIPPYELIVIERASNDGLEVHANTSKLDHRSVWRISEDLCGTQIVSYWEDSEWIKSAVDNRSSNKWERGKHIWISEQIRFANNFLNAVKQIADYFDFTGEVRIRVLFSGLKGRSLRSAHPGAYYSAEYLAHQNTKQIDFVRNIKQLDDDTRSSTTAFIVQSINKLTQGPEVTAERVVNSLKSGQI